MPRKPRAYRLSTELLATYGGPVLCLSALGEGRSYRLHRRRPGPASLRVATRTEAGLEWRRPRAGFEWKGGGAQLTPEPEAAERALILVSIDGPFHNVLKIKPPIIWGEAEADRLLSTLDRVLREQPLRP